MIGAPEEIVASCSGVDAAVNKELENETKKGRRVIATANRKIDPAELQKDFGLLEKGLTFAGLISFEDPPRREVKETIAKAAKAGIRTIMVTGDHPATAAYIACQVGIACDTSSVLTGEELDRLTDDQLKDTVKKISVFARTTPQHKYRIVRALQAGGEVVAVTGDGINDALALKGADIGIAMGVKGTDVAKEAAEVVLADDNFNVIAKAIFEGRKFFDNLRKGIKYYLCVKAALVMIFLLPVLINVPMPFSPIQIILLELFMDLAASAGFVSEPQEKDIYLRAPRSKNEDVINTPAVIDIFTKGILLFACVMAVYFYARSMGYGFVVTQTYAFSAWIFAHIAMAYVSRSDRQPLASTGLFTNSVINAWGALAIAFLLCAVYVPVLSRQFNLTPIPVATMATIAVFVWILVGLTELRKLAKRA